MARTKVTQSPAVSGNGQMAGSLDDMRRHAGDAEALLKALANRNRLLILCALAGGELSVTALNEQVPLSQSALSQHLAVLRQDGIVGTRRESQTIYYSLAGGPATAVMTTLHAIYCGVPSKPPAARGTRRRRI